MKKTGLVQCISPVFLYGRETLWNISRTFYLLKVMLLTLASPPSTRT